MAGDIENLLWEAERTIESLTARLASAEALLREACIGYEHNYDDASSDKRLRRVPIFHTWYERAVQAAKGGRDE